MAALLLGSVWTSVLAAGEDVEPCSGPDRGVPDPIQGACLCEEGFAGSSCQYSDADDCNGNPVTFSGACNCTADPFLSGDHCQCVLESVIGSTDSDSCYICAVGYSGPACTLSRAATCNGHGDPDGVGTLTSDETCRCDFGYGGAACELSSVVDCTGNGRIRDDGTCVCMPGYTGDCSVWDCSGASGVADGERCNCNGAWTGDRCQCLLGSLGRGTVAVNCTQCAAGYSPGADINGNSVCERSGCPDGFIGYNCECGSAISNLASCTNCAAGFGLAGTLGRCSLVNPNAYYANAFSGPAPPTPPPSGGDDDTDDDDGAELAEMFIWLSVVILFFALLAVIGLLHQCKTGQSDNAGGRREFEGWWQAYLLIAFGAMDQLCGVLYAAYGAVEGAAYYIGDEPQDAALAFAVLLNLVPACWFLGAGYGLADFKFADVRWQWSQRIFWSWMLIDDNLEPRKGVPEWASMVYVGFFGIPVILNVIVASLAAATIWLIIPFEIIRLVLEQSLANAFARITTLWSYFSRVWLPAVSCSEPKGQLFVLAGPAWLIMMLTMLVCSILFLAFSVTLVFVLPSLYACFTMLRVHVLWPNGWQSFESAVKSITGTMRILSKTGGTLQPQPLDLKEHAQIIGNLMRPVTAVRGKGGATVAEDQCFVLAVTVMYQAALHAFPLLIIAGSGAMSDLAITTVAFSSFFIALALLRFVKGGMWSESDSSLFDKLAEIGLFVDQASGTLVSAGGSRTYNAEASDYSPTGETGLPPINPNAPKYDSGQKGQGHSSSGPALPPLPDAPWNCLSMEKDASVQRIQGKPPGSFVIRKSDKAFAALTMANKGNKVYHQHIEKTSQGQYRLLSSRMTHSTLQAMIQHHSDPQNPVTGYVWLIGATHTNTNTNEKIQKFASVTSENSIRSRGGSVSSVDGHRGYIKTYPGDETSSDFGFDQHGRPNLPPPNFGGGGGGGYETGPTGGGHEYGRQLSGHSYLAPTADEDDDAHYEAIDESRRPGDRGGGGADQSISDEFGGFGGAGQSIRRQSSDEFGGFVDAEKDPYAELGGSSDDFSSPPPVPSRSSATAKPGLAGFMGPDEDFGGFGDDLGHFSGLSYNDVEPLED